MGIGLAIKFWGTRGLISSPRTDTAIFGGNTSCMQIIYKNKLIIIDTGFGVSNLGELLFEQALRGVNLEIHIFFSHFHWDHVQGLPFFHPIYFPSTKLHLYSPLPKEQTFENLDILFDGSYSPFSGLNSMPSKIEIIQMQEKTIIDDLIVEFCELDHHGDEQKNDDNKSFSFKFSEKFGLNIVIASDHEARNSQLNDNFIEFSKNCDLLIHGAQFTESEYLTRNGWGHSSFKQALDNSVKIAANKTIFTHHAPNRSDSEIQAIYREYKEKKEYKQLHFEFAREERIYDVEYKKAK